ncbi:MAG: putative Ig domain-containing protein, partial [Candidatus Nanohalobium sp.]
MNNGSLLFPQEGNSAPYFTSDPAVTGEVGKAYSYDAEATDPDGNALSYSLNQSPSGMSIDSDSGKVSWTPSSSGTYDVEIVVSDGEASVSQSYSIDVQSDNSGGGSDNPEDGGGSDDSDGGSSGGSSGGDSYSGGGWYFVSQSQSIEERLSFVDQAFNLELRQGATGKRNISLNFTEQTRVNLGTEGNISEVLKLPASINGRKGINNVKVAVNATQPGNYTGNITVSWEGQTLEIPVSITVRPVDEFEGEMDVAILGNTARL